MNKPRKIPQRMCVGCRQMKNKKELMRVVKTSEGDIQLDPTGKKSGRGAYICPNESCFNQAIKGKRLQKALEQEIPGEVIQLINKQIGEFAP